VQALHSAFEVKDFLLGEFLHCPAVGAATLREVEEHFDLSEGETDLLGSFDEPKKGDTVGSIGAVAGVLARRLREQPSALVVAERLDVDAGFSCDPSCSHIPSLNPVPRYRVKPHARDDLPALTLYPGTASMVLSMPDMLAARQIGAQGDLARTPSIMWLWGAPLAMVITASVLNGIGILSLTGAGVLWTLATVWIGIGCVINARHCGRVHCRIDGVLFPVLSLVGVLNVVGIVNFNWNVYWAAFLAILGASFVPEFFWKRYV